MYDTMKDKRIGRRRGDREVRRAAGEGHRGAGADRRLHRQRAGRAGHRRQDRGAAHRRIWRPRNAARARRRDQAGEAPPDADRQCRARRALSKRLVTLDQHVDARRAGRRPRGARAGLQAADRVPQGDGVHHADAARRGEIRHRCERDRGRSRSCRPATRPPPPNRRPPPPRPGRPADPRQRRPVRAAAEAARPGRRRTGARSTPQALAAARRGRRARRPRSTARNTRPSARSTA